MCSLRTLIRLKLVATAEDTAGKGLSEQSNRKLLEHDYTHFIHIWLPPKRLNLALRQETNTRHDNPETFTATPESVSSCTTWARVIQSKFVLRYLNLLWGFFFKVVKQLVGE